MKGINLADAISYINVYKLNSDKPAKTILIVIPALSILGGLNPRMNKADYIITYDGLRVCLPDIFNMHTETGLSIKPITSKHKFIFWDDFHDFHGAPNSTESAEYMSQYKSEVLTRSECTYTIYWKELA